MAKQKRYPSDLSDAQRAILEPLLYPTLAHPGRPPRVPRRDVVDAIVYVLRTGCQWRYLPEGFPHWNTVYWYFKRWRDDGTWERVNDVLRRRLRVHLGREPEASAAILDSQSARTTEKGGSAASTPARRSRGASGTSWSTPRDC
jgi:putative transposase